FKPETLDEMAELLNDQTIDVIIGGPPCQGFSLTGKRQENDERNTLFYSMVRAVERFQPKAFILENVPGLATLYNGKAKEVILKEFGDLGYTINYQVLYAPDYGVPQIRKRIFFVGLKNGKKFDFPKPIFTPENYVTCEQAIGDLPKLYPTLEYKLQGKKFSHTQPDYDFIKNHSPRFHNMNDIDTFRLLAEDIEMARFEYVSIEKIKELYTQKTGKKSSVHKYYVLRREEPSNTIPAHLHKDGLRHIHYDSKQARSITVRESARLQTFDDDYEFISSAGANYKMIGNAVPPLFSEKLAFALDIFLKQINREPHDPIYLANR
ncbi:DNA cytosine methyltransferase, partial [Staphylococcus epidermidis]